MQATTIRYRDDGSIELREVPVDDPGPGEVQVQGAVVATRDIRSIRAREAPGR
jgi:hypothetical protein